MSTKHRIRINIIDLVILLVVFLLCLSFIVRRTNVIDYLSKNYVQETIITLSVQGIDRDNFNSFELNDTVYTEKGKIGKINNIKSAPSIITTIDDDIIRNKPDFENIDLTVEILTDCLVDQNGFFSIGGQYITPASKFTADNGRIKFDCVVLSVRKHE